MAAKKAPAAPIVNDDDFDDQAALAKLRGKAKAAPKPSSKADRKVIELTPSDLEVVGEMIAVDTIGKMVKSRLDSHKDQALAALFDAYTADFWRQKSRPENPSVVIYQDDGRTVDHSVTYQMQTVFSFKEFTKPGANAAALILEALTAGDEDDLSRLTEAQAQRVIDEEIISEPRTRLKYTLSDLMEGHFENQRYVEATDEEKRIGKKLLRILSTSVGADGRITVPGFTDEEQAFLVINDEEVKFRDPSAFLARVCLYVENLHQLRRVLSTFKPRCMFTQYEFAKNDNPKDKQARLTEVASQVLGTPAD